MRAEKLKVSRLANAHGCVCPPHLRIEAVNAEVGEGRRAVYGRALDNNDDREGAGISGIKSFDVGIGLEKWSPRPSTAATAGPPPDDTPAAPMAPSGRGNGHDSGAADNHKDSAAASQRLGSFSSSLRRPPGKPIEGMEESTKVGEKKGSGITAGSDLAGQENRTAAALPSSSVMATASIAVAENGGGIRAVAAVRVMSSNRSLEVLADGLTVGSLVYSDRDETLLETGFLGPGKGFRYVRLSCEDKKLGSEVPWLVLDLERPFWILLAYFGLRASSHEKCRPWIAREGWFPAALALPTTSFGHADEVRARRFPAGRSVIHGHNSRCGGGAGATPPPLVVLRSATRSSSGSPTPSTTPWSVDDADSPVSAIVTTTPIVKEGASGADAWDGPMVAAAFHPATAARVPYPTGDFPPLRHAAAASSLTSSSPSSSGEGSTGGGEGLSVDVGVGAKGGGTSITIRGAGGSPATAARLAGNDRVHGERSSNSSSRWRSRVVVVPAVYKEWFQGIPSWVWRAIRRNVTFFLYQRLDSKAAHFVPLHGGYEDGVYLTFLVDFFEDLPEIVVFTHPHGPLLLNQGGGFDCFLPSFSGHLNVAGLQWVERGVDVWKPFKYNGQTLGVPELCRWLVPSHPNVFGPFWSFTFRALLAHHSVFKRVLKFRVSTHLFGKVHFTRSNGRWL